MKKKLLKKVKKASPLLFVGILLLASCNKLEITESNFNQRNLKEFSLGFEHEGINLMPDAEIKKILEKTERSTAMIEDMLPDTWYYYSWQSGKDLSEFTLLRSGDCIEELWYFVFSGKEWKDDRLVASRTSCGDFDQQTTAVVDGHKLTFSSYANGIGQVFPFMGTQTCEISAEGIFICEPEVVLNPGVSLWNGLALRETPDKKGKFITRVNIGETFMTADSAEVNDEDEYLHIQLKDGTLGYILNRLVMQEAVPMAILKNAPIYRRPDELTKTSDIFYAMDVVGLSEFAGDYEWFKVKGKPAGQKWFKEGWIKSNNSTQNPIDIAVASLISTAMEEKDLAKRVLSLDAIRANNDFSSSGLMAYIDQLIQEQL